MSSLRAVEHPLSLSNPVNIVPGISGLTAVRNQMDSSFGGSSSDDLLTSKAKQKEIVPHIDNLILALQKQQ
jgi:hypothetical protein